MKLEKSCGSIIIDNDKVLIIKQKNIGNYGFPKGHMEKGETELLTAIRETKEEVGLDVEINENKKYYVSYMKGEDVLKEVVYFLAKLKNDKDIVIQEAEIENYQWIEIDKVRDILTYENLKIMWDQVYKDIKEN